ncbi:hypothetical protein PHA8399_01297 [Leisingera aquaemixtae]|uniref:Nucleotidyltransferase-like domain-containing protein n=1 Tax=Leisingera aquaemixtae TaxID=1396826 RepID=A0A0P1H810_9RHOB|nr:hypothetical protein PHA8399_01297 [Leisingera aquaemixtae]
MPQEGCTPFGAYIRISSKSVLQTLSDFCLEPLVASGSKTLVEWLPVSLQTLYAEAVDRSWGGSYAELLEAGGTPYKRSLKGRDYWYFKTSSVGTGSRKDLYLGPDTSAVRQRVDELRDLKRIRRDRISMIRALRAAGLPAPDAMSGKVLSALCEAGVPRLQAVVVGIIAFQTYGPMLGVRFNKRIAQASDPAQLHSVSIYVDKQIEGDLLSLLHRVDERFRLAPQAFDSTNSLKYVLAPETQEEFSVYVLHPLAGSERRGRSAERNAIQGDDEILRYLGFLIKGEINAVDRPCRQDGERSFATHVLAGRVYNQGRLLRSYLHTP